MVEPQHPRRRNARRQRETRALAAEEGLTYQQALQRMDEMQLGNRPAFAERGDRPALPPLADRAPWPFALDALTGEAIAFDPVEALSPGGSSGILVVGAPASGKSVALARLAVAACRAQRPVAILDVDDDSGLYDFGSLSDANELRQPYRVPSPSVAALRGNRYGEGLVRLSEEALEHASDSQVGLLVLDGDLPYYHDADGSYQALMGLINRARSLRVVVAMGSRFVPEDGGHVLGALRARLVLRQHGSISATKAAILAGRDNDGTSEQWLQEQREGAGIWRGGDLWASSHIVQVLPPPTWALNVEEAREEAAMRARRIPVFGNLPDSVTIDESLPVPGWLGLGVGRVDGTWLQTISWNLSERGAPIHLLTAGPSGVGKTTLLRTISTQALAEGWPVLIADPRGTDYSWADDFPSARRASGTRASEAIDWAIAEMEQRLSPAGSRDAPSTSLTPMLVVVELAELLNQADMDETERERVLDALTLLGHRGRSACVHMALAVEPLYEERDKQLRGIARNCEIRIEFDNGFIPGRATMTYDLRDIELQVMTPSSGSQVAPL